MEIHKSIIIIEMENYHEHYIKSLSEKELQAYLIAKSHLGSSFSLEKSLGFIKWLESEKSKNPSVNP
jgi:hypothetical protein